MLQKQLIRERERSGRLANENLDLSSSKKRLEMNLRSEKMNTESKEAMGKRKSAKVLRELEEQKYITSRTKRDYRVVLLSAGFCHDYDSEF